MAMSKGSVNKVILVGHLGRDPEVRYTPSGDAVADVSLATTEVYKDKSGESKERTDWHKIVLWRSQAEFAKEWLKKGQLVYVEGKLQTHQWEDKDNQKRYKTEIYADHVTMLGGSVRGKEKETPELDVPPTQTEASDIPF